MKTRHLLIGVVLWLTVAWVGFRWVWRPMQWAHPIASIDGPGTLEDARRAFPIHVASFRTDAPVIARQGLFDDEPDAEFEAVQDWAFRETRNRFCIAFLLWMASGFFIHWFLGRIVRGQKDYT